MTPKIFNQGGYDAAQVTVPDKILPGKIFVRFVQITRSKTHILKLRYMYELLTSLCSIGFQIYGVEVVFVVPAGNCSTFKLGEVSGDMRNYDKAWKFPSENSFEDDKDRRIFVTGLVRTE